MEILITDEQSTAKSVKSFHFQLSCDYLILNKTSKSFVIIIKRNLFTYLH